MEQPNILEELEHPQYDTAEFLKGVSSHAEKHKKVITELDESEGRVLYWVAGMVDQLDSVKPLERNDMWVRLREPEPLDLWLVLSVGEGLFRTDLRRDNNELVKTIRSAKTSGMMPEQCSTIMVGSWHDYLQAHATRRNGTW